MRTAALCFGVLATAYAVAPVRVQTDSIWSIPTALSIANDGDTDLSEYGRATEETPHGLDRLADGSVHSTFPVGGSVLAAPILWLTNLLSDVLVWLPEPLNQPFLRWKDSSRASPDVRLRFFDTTEMLIASVLVSIGVVAFFFLCRRFAEFAPSLIVSLALAIGSPALSTWTRALWSHGPAFMSVSIAAALIVWKPAHLRAQFCIGLALAFAVISRPTAAIPAAVLFGLNAFRHLRTRQYLLLMLQLGGAILVLAPWFAWTWKTWGTLVPSYYSPQRLDSNISDALSALASQLFSPSRGLLVYVPFVLLGFGLPFAGRQATSPHLLALVLGLFHLIAVSRFPHWWGGHCYGPRLSSDAVPFFLFASLPVVSLLVKRLRTRIFVVLLAAWGFITNLPGATHWSTVAWNGIPVDVDAAPQRVWDWSDPQFRR